MSPHSAYRAFSKRKRKISELSETAPFIRPDMKAFLDALSAMDGPTITDMTLAEARESYVALHQMADRPARDLAVIRDLTCPGPAGKIPLRLYDTRENRDAGPIVTFFHGGGFVIGDLETHHALCTEIAELVDLPLVAVNYRLAPENPFPAAVEDCEAAARWTAASPKELGRMATGLVMIGDSAGGTATIVVGQQLPGQQEIAVAVDPVLLSPERRVLDLSV